MDAFSLLVEALERWKIDQELGSSQALVNWVDDFLDEKGVARTFVTKTGRVLTDEDFERFADEEDGR